MFATEIYQRIKIKTFTTSLNLGICTKLNQNINDEKAVSIIFNTTSNLSFLS